MRISRAHMLLAVATAVGGAQLHAQSATPSLIDSIAATVRDQYVFGAKGAAAAEQLLRLHRDGRFRSASTPDELAQAITRELRALLDGDAHAALLPPQVAASRAGTTVGAAPPSMSRGAPPPGVAGVSREERADAERRLGHYFRETERRPGNVLVIVFEQFPLMTPQAAAVGSAVMQLAATADAVIFDLRHNRGGAEGLNQFLASHFFPADTSKVLYARYQRRGDIEVPTRVLATLEAPRMPETPLYIVTGGGTVSAAENLTYTLQQHGRATVVGQKTMGAANSSTLFAMPEGFALQVPTARVIHPVTRTNWEGTGITPNVVVPVDVAVDTAYALALRKLAATAGDETRRAELERLFRRLVGNDPSASPTAGREFAPYVGRYGLVEFRIERGRLVSQAFGADGRPGAVLRMLPRGDDWFEYEDYPGIDRVLIRFTRDSTGAVVARSGFNPTTGAWVETPRSR